MPSTATASDAFAPSCADGTNHAPSRMRSTTTPRCSNRLTTSAVTTIPMRQAGTVMARICVSPSPYSSVSVRVTMAAMAADTGDAARAMPDCTTVSDIGLDGRMPFL